MLREVRMPALGQTTDELRILGWLKQEGESVTQGEPLFEVETDKATLEVEAFAAGVLLKIVQRANALVEVGALVAYIGAREDVVPAAPETGAPSVVALPQSVAAVVAPRSQPGKVLASPAVRALAQAHGIDLTLVRGSGPGGRIERPDVQRLIDLPAATTATLDHVEPAATTAKLDHDVPIAPQRQVIARRLTRSIQTIPQIALTATVDMRAARTDLERERAQGLTRLTYTHLLLRAVATALRSHPRLNSLWREDGTALHYLAHANIGLAVAADDSLLVVTITEPDTLPFAELVTSTDAAITRARQGNLTTADMAPAAISISNLGMHRVESFTAIVDPAQTAILAIGRITEQPVVAAGAVRSVPCMHMTLTVDHRVADGVVAARFLDTLCAVLENLQEDRS